jgi:hypothetical protein
MTTALVLFKTKHPLQEELRLLKAGKEFEKRDDPLLSWSKTPSKQLSV